MRLNTACGYSASSMDIGPTGCVIELGGRPQVTLRYTASFITRWNAQIDWMLFKNQVCAFNKWRRVFSTNINWLMQFSEILVAVCSENRTKTTDTRRDQNAVSVKWVGYIVATAFWIFAERNLEVNLALRVGRTRWSVRIFSRQVVFARRKTVFVSLTPVRIEQVQTGCAANTGSLRRLIRETKAQYSYQSRGCMRSPFFFFRISTNRTIRKVAFEWNSCLIRCFAGTGSCFEYGTWKHWNNVTAFTFRCFF
jgi:hypothetical protein